MLSNHQMVLLYMARFTSQKSQDGKHAVMGQENSSVPENSVLLKSQME